MVHKVKKKEDDFSLEQLGDISDEWQDGLEEASYTKGEDEEEDDEEEGMFD